MKKPIKRKSEKEILQNYPIKSLVKGWYFRMTEISFNTWEVEGTDHFGRLLYRQGNDSDKFLIDCERDAKDLVINDG